MKGISAFHPSFCQDQLASLSSSASLLDICQAVMDELMSLEDRGHSVCDMFMKLPAQSQYPDYYRVITEPIDVKMILQNIKVSCCVLMLHIRLYCT